MKGFGFVGDIVIASLGVLSLLGWMYFWLLCVSAGEKLLGRVFGRHALAVVLIGFPFFAAFLFAVALKVLGREHIGWALIPFGIGLPVLGILYLRREFDHR